MITFTKSDADRCEELKAKGLEVTHIMSDEAGVIIEVNGWSYRAETYQAAFKKAEADQ